MFRLLPMQVLLAAVGAVNGIVSGYFASNYVGVDAMSAVGIYGPIDTFVGALSDGYRALRGLLLNWKIQAVVGTVGISAMATSKTVLSMFWAIPTGMMAVSRLIISVSIGEEDRRSLIDTMKGMLKVFVPLMCVISVGLSLLAEPLTRIFFQDPSQPVYMMTVRGIRIVPFAMPLIIICQHFTCYAQASGKKLLVRLLAVLDGVVDMVVFVYLFIGLMGLDSVYFSYVFDGAVIVLVVVGYALIKKKRFPKSMEDLLVIPEDFGVPEDDRMDLSVRSVEEVVGISQKVRDFCLDKGIDARRAFMASLAMEEMAGNVVEHGFDRDRKPHSVDVRVVYKNDDLILRLKDDCVPFDPASREKLRDRNDPAKDVGIHMVYSIAKDIQYRNELGLNILTIRI